jgi:hypothetical protein
MDIRLREFARRLAETHDMDVVPQDTVKPLKSDLLEHLKSWELSLRNANAIFKAVSSKDLSVSRAGEWMLDNFYIVKQNLRQIEEDLPASFLNELPKLTGTLLQGHSRIFALAREWIGYCQSQIDLTQAAAFVQEYQQVLPLTIGELWALPIMLRIGILERLVYVTSELTGMDIPDSLLSTYPTRPLLPTVFLACACFPQQIGMTSLNGPVGWNRFCATIPHRYIQAWILIPATVIAVSSRNWRAIQISAKNKSRSPQLNSREVRMKKSH